MEKTSELNRVRACMEDYLRQRGLPLRKMFRCLSPAHEDKHPSMSYNPRANNVHCFACGITYDLFDLIGVDYGLDGFAERYSKACELFGFSVPGITYQEERRGMVRTETAVSTVELTLSNAVEPSGCLVELEKLRRKSDGDMSYFLSRGITEESCMVYGLFQQGGRAYFPIWEGGRCTGWSARALGDGTQPRYKNSFGGIGLWNGDYISQNGGGARLFITEGIIDAICLEQLGEKAIALCGSQNTGKLLHRCRNNLGTAGNWRFVTCGDPDMAGEKMDSALTEGLKSLGFECVALSLDKADGDIGQLYQKNRAKLKRAVSGMFSDNTARDEYAATSVAAGLAAFFREAKRRAEQGAVPTGFAALDRLLDGGLYPGLYVLGAISSLGKTSLALQIADYIAENTVDVLFFSLEQSRSELMAKSMSRTSAQLDGRDMVRAFTARQLLTGQTSGDSYRQQLLADAAEVYAKTAARLYIREGMAEIGVEEIRRSMWEHQLRRGAAPVVIVDYLQILRPSDPRATDKQNTDRAVVELKRLSRDFDVPVVAISSFNRENYRTAVSMEAFKESGAVEYSSDVLLGLQLAGVGEKDFDVNRAKSREPRKLELVLLKNRNGAPYAKIPLEYKAKFSLFSEI